MMDNFGRFGIGNGVDSSKLSKMLVQMKQISSDVTNIIPVSKDPEIVKEALKMTPIYEQLRKVSPPESTYSWNNETSDNFGKFVAESNAATRFAAQKGTYGTGSVATRLMSYVLNIGMVAQKNVSGYTDLIREEQQIGMEAMRKGIERCLITGAPAAATDGGVTDALAFSGLDTLLTGGNVTDLLGAALDIDDLDTALDKCKANGAAQSELIMVTDPYTHTSIASQFYNIQNMQLGTFMAKAGFEVDSYRRIPIFDCDYCPTTAGLRTIYLIDTRTTVIPEFYGISQIDLGRTQLSDDSVMFWMGALAVKKAARNQIIKNIL